MQYDSAEGLKSVIDGDLHGVQDVWDTNSSTNNWSFLLVDAKNK